MTIVRDRHSGESKGFGFVRMGTEQGAAAALQALDNYLIGEGVDRQMLCSALVGTTVERQGPKGGWLPTSDREQEV